MARALVVATVRMIKSQELDQSLVKPQDAPRHCQTGSGASWRSTYRIERVTNNPWEQPKPTFRPKTGYLSLCRNVVILCKYFERDRNMTMSRELKRTFGGGKPLVKTVHNDISYIHIFSFKKSTRMIECTVLPFCIVSTSKSMCKSVINYTFTWLCERKHSTFPSSSFSANEVEYKGYEPSSEHLQLWRDLKKIRSRDVCMFV